MFEYVFGTPESSTLPDANVPVRDAAGDFIKEEKDGYLYIDAKAPCFVLGGIRHPDENNGEYYRLNAYDKSVYSGSNSYLAESTSGATLRFVTNADSFRLKTAMRGVNAGMQHFANRGAYGFDVYTGTGSDRRYCGAMMQMMTSLTGFEETIKIPSPCEVMIDFPLYGGVTEVLIGIPENTMLARAPSRYFKPIAFYGSSITQGGCVSRPGNMYSNIICRALNCDNINLGFSGSAFGEQSVASYLCERELSVFVMDYDFNARSLDELRDTHLPFYQTFKKAHPDTPVVIVSHPYYAAENQGDRDRKNILRATYEKARENGDRVFFVDSESFFPEDMRDLNAVDFLHPNDLGHYRMASAIYPAVLRALGGKRND